MDIKDFQGIAADNFGPFVSKVQTYAPAKIGTKEYLCQLDVRDHDVNKNEKRPDKVKIIKGSTSLVPVTRLPVSYQKIISSRAAAFLCGNPIRLISNPQEGIEADFMDAFNLAWDKNKLDYKSLHIAQLCCQETEVAELWYVQPAEDGYWGDGAFKSGFKLRSRILANSLGDTLYPAFDAMGDMIAFGRGYVVAEGDRKINHFDLYLPTQTIKGVQTGTGWTATVEENPIGKIPVIYFSQDKPEWYDVQKLIERFETAFSNNGDTNDYFSSPILKAIGEVGDLGNKADSGKVIKLKAGASVDYLVWDQQIDAIKLEYDTLQKLIYNLTDTPDISFESMKSIGTFSGIALKMLFMGAHLKASLKAGGGFGESMQRRINFIKAALMSFNLAYSQAASLAISPQFDYFLPKNVQEAITFLTDAAGPGTPIMSQETAVRLNPLVDDPEDELEKLNDEGKLGSEILSA